MDRMTQKLEFGGYKRNCENCPYYEECETEDLTCEDFMLMKLGELEDKIENGTLIELPCKVGDKIYMPWEYDGVSAVAELTVNYIFLDMNIGSSSIQTNLECDVAEYMRRYSYGLFKFEDIGKKIFLTKAEAEAKLKEIQDGEH